MSPRPAPAQGTGGSRKFLVMAISGVLLVAVGAMFAGENSQRVQVRFFTATGHFRLVLVVAASVLLGLVLGLLGRGAR